MQRRNVFSYRVSDVLAAFSESGEGEPSAFRGAARSVVLARATKRRTAAICMHLLGRASVKVDVLRATFVLTPRRRSPDDTAGAMPPPPGEPSGMRRTTLISHFALPPRRLDSPGLS